MPCPEIRVQGAVMPPLPADHRNRIRLVVEGRRGLSLWRAVVSALDKASNDEKEEEGSVTGINPCVWREMRWGRISRETPTPEAFMADPPPNLEVFLTAGNGRRNRDRYSEARKMEGKLWDFTVKIVPYSVSDRAEKVFRRNTVSSRDMKNLPGRVSSGGAETPDPSARTLSGVSVWLSSLV
jgi:hypothetical protein